MTWPLYYMTAMHSGRMLGVRATTRSRLLARMPLPSVCAPTQQCALLLRRQLEHIAYQQIRMIARIAVEACRQRAGEYPAVVHPA